MENENKPDPELEEDGKGAEGGEGEPKPKPELTPEQIEGIERRQLTKLAKKYGVDVQKPKSAPEKKEEKTGFDYGELAYLTAKGVPEEDNDWLIEGLESTGKELKDLLKSEWVQKELKERSAARAADTAIPTGTKRSQGGVTTEDTVEYWVALDKQPPATKPLEFRKKVLDARVKKTEQGSKFATDSLISPF